MKGNDGVQFNTFKITCRSGWTHDFVGEEGCAENNIWFDDKPWNDASDMGRCYIPDVSTKVEREVQRSITGK
jgi:hypothetical protein